MSKEMVEPKRKYVDIEVVYKKQRMRRQAGPGGLLSVTIVQARDLRWVCEYEGPCLPWQLHYASKKTRDRETMLNLRLSLIQLICKRLPLLS